MKSLSLALIAALVLAACSSPDDSKPAAVASPAPADEQVLILSLTEEEEGRSNILPVKQGGECVLLNGKFAKRSESSNGNELEIVTYQFATKLEGGVYSYAMLGDQFFVADGRVKHLKTNRGEGTIRVSCTENSLVFASQEEGKNAESMTFTLLENGQLRVDSGSQEAELFDGLYTKE